MSVGVTGSQAGFGLSQVVVPIAALSTVQKSSALPDSVQL